LATAVQGIADPSLVAVVEQPVGIEDPSVVSVESFAFVAELPVAEDPFGRTVDEVEPLPVTLADGSRNLGKE